MRGVIPAFLFFLLCAAAPAAHADSDITLLGIYSADGNIPYQGPCAPRPIDQHFSTAACYGGSQEMVKIKYQNEKIVCVYVDNFNSARAEFFIPLRTYKEWTSFRDRVAANKIEGMSLVYGCPVIRIEDECHRYHDMPDGRHGDTTDITSTGDYRATYQCDAPKSCGLWKKTSSTGQCHNDGVCGAAQEHATHEPPTQNLCNWGTASPVSLAGEYYVWNCAGTEGGDTVSCQSYYAGVQECGAANGMVLADLNMFDPGLCPPGSLLGDFTRHGNIWSWNCYSGVGDTLIYASCSASYGSQQ